ncbi:MAG: protein kinase [Ruminiclostridium sp.]
MKRCYSCFEEYNDSFELCPLCGQISNNKPKEPIQLVPGTVLANRYVIGYAVGSGGFGIVYKALDTKYDTVVAVKEFYVGRLVTRAEGQKNVIVSKKAQKEYDYRKERFLAEARTMAKFGSHRSIPNVFEFFEENNTAYIVMELLNGVALNEYQHQQDAALDVDFAIMIANEVGNALLSLHEQNIIHRDVAPDNIFICSGKELRVKLMDLGAAKLADSTDNVIDIILKPGYSPTEQYDNSKNIGPWTDIYALGATLYYMVTNIKPDESTNRKINDEVVPPHLINPLVSENLSNAIMKALAVEKHMRFKNVAEFLAAINGERKVITLKKEKRRRNIRRMVAIASACAAIAVGAVVGLGVYNNMLSKELLNPADITVWFSVNEGSNEEKAMEAVKENFESTFTNVKVELKAIPASDYAVELEKAANEGKLPTLFESTGVSDMILSQAQDLDKVIGSEQFKKAWFLDKYNNYYDNKKQVPLAIEVPVAYVITNGTTCVEYSDKYFKKLSDFGDDVIISGDERYSDMLERNFGYYRFGSSQEFLNSESKTSPVLISSTMTLSEIKNNLLKYPFSCVYYDSDIIYCDFTYEWSVGGGSDSETAAAEKLLSWMLGNVYQQDLMIEYCYDGQIPVNPESFEAKINSKKDYAPMRDIKNKFYFIREDN